MAYGVAGVTRDGLQICAYVNIIPVGLLVLIGGALLMCVRLQTSDLKFTNRQKSTSFYLLGANV